MTAPAIFAPQGLLALRADAYGKAHEPGLRVPSQLMALSSSGPIVANAVAAAAEPPRGPCIAVVNIRGPLAQHFQYKPDCPQSYEEILSWGRCAIMSPYVTHIVLAIASPGGVVAGCFDMARTLRELANQNGKFLLAFVEGQACSAAYAIATVCHWIATADTSELGSIGVIAQLAEQTELDAKTGLKFEFITSGARKSDGNAHIAITDPARAATQSSVDTAAGLFYDFVANRRPLARDAVQGLEAATYFGAQAVELRLADQVCDREQFFAEILSGATERNIMAMNVKEAVAALAATMTDEKADEKDKKQARKMLAALAAEDDAPAKKDDEDEDDEKKEAKAEDEQKEKEAAAAKSALAASSTAPVLAASSTVDPVARQLAKEARDIAAFTARQLMYGGRPDLTTEQRSMLDGLPLKAAQNVLLAMLPAAAPQAAPGAPAAAPAVTTALAAASAVPTTTESAPVVISAETQARFARMGLVEETHPRGIRLEGGVLHISARPAKPVALVPPAAPAAQ